MKRSAEDVAKRKLLREAAREAGFKTYLPDGPCAHGHLALRYVRTDGCTRCVAATNAKKAQRKGIGLNLIDPKVPPTEATPPTAICQPQIQSAEVKAPEARTLSPSMAAAVEKEIGHNPFDVEFDDTPAAATEPAERPAPRLVSAGHSDEWHVLHGYVRYEGEWVDRIWLTVRLAQQEAVAAEQVWREAQGLPPHIAEARIPMKARRAKRQSPPLSFEGDAKPADQHAGP